ncbi:MAG: hypothetical protein AB7V27_05900 [Candidatus Binatia bacterium]
MRAGRRSAVLAAVIAGVLALPASETGAQLRTPGAGAVSEDAGPIGEHSRPLGEGSGPVRDGRATLGETSEPMRSGPVRDGTTRSMRSGPVSSLSRGPMTQPRTLRDGGSMTESSAGAVKHDKHRALGSRISQPLRELAPLQAHLRALRAQGDGAAITAAGAPMADLPEDAMVPELVPEDELPPDAEMHGNDHPAADPAPEIADEIPASVDEHELAAP